MKWMEMSAEQRFQMVKLADSQEVDISALCKSLGISRQTLYRAMDVAQQAATDALEPKRPGRKPKPQAEVKLSELQQDQARLEKELSEYKTKYEVAKTVLDLQRKLDRGELLPGEEKKKPRRRRGRKTGARRRRTAGKTAKMAHRGDGGGDGN